MTVAFSAILPRLALVMSTIALLFSLVAPRPARRPKPARRDHDGHRDVRPRDRDLRPGLRPGRGVRPALTDHGDPTMLSLFAAESAPDGGGPFMLWLTAALAVAALFYLGYAMIRP